MNLTKKSELMVMSQALGLAFFLIVNFIKLPLYGTVETTCIQIVFNACAFFWWASAFQKKAEMEKDNLGPFKTILIALLEILVCTVDFVTRQENLKGSFLSKGFLLACGVIIPVVLGSITISRVIIPFLFKTLSLL